MSDVGGIAGAQLKSIIERIERLEEEKKALGEDIKEIFAEAKGNGFEPKVIRKVLALRGRERAEIDEERTLLELYCQAIGMAV